MRLQNCPLELMPVLGNPKIFLGNILCAICRLLDHQTQSCPSVQILPNPQSPDLVKLTSYVPHSRHDCDTPVNQNSCFSFQSNLPRFSTTSMNSVVPDKSAVIYMLAIFAAVHTPTMFALYFNLLPKTIKVSKNVCLLLSMSPYSHTN